VRRTERSALNRRFLDLSAEGLSDADRAWIEQLTPLRLEARGMWDPEEEYWGEDGEPIESWATPIIARGPRPMFEMEQVVPGFDPDQPDRDPIEEAVELGERGRQAQARRILLRLIDRDPRCLDAYAHLGNLVFRGDPQRALAHYALGAQIGRRALGERFDGVLPWGMIDNRPFLRCVHGFGLCLWRLRRFEEAARIFEQLLWLSPSDNLGVRFILPTVRARKRWTEDT
jgi:tetratricopeptide (TPR) repeat protein